MSKLASFIELFKVIGHWTLRTVCGKAVAKIVMQLNESLLMQYRCDQMAVLFPEEVSDHEVDNRV